MLTLPILLISCSKSDKPDEGRDNDPEENNPFPGCLVTKVERQGFDPIILTYDNNKRIINHKFGTIENTYSYSGNTINTVNITLGLQRFQRTITLNEHGLAVKVRTDNRNLSWSEEIYEYEGTQVVKKSTKTDLNPNFVITRYLWQDGNMVEEHAPGGKITRYTFDKTKPFQPGEHLGRVDLEMGYTVVRNKNRMISVTDYLGITVTHGFVEDDQGRITHESYRYSTGSNWTEKITYKCP